jgi:hypothetical protein
MLNACADYAKERNHPATRSSPSSFKRQGAGHPQGMEPGARKGRHYISWGQIKLDKVVGADYAVSTLKVDYQRSQSSVQAGFIIGINL